MNIDKRWETAYFPDFGIYKNLNPIEGINLISAEPMAPDKVIPQFMIDAAKASLDRMETGYPHSNEEDEIKNAIAKKLKAFNGLDINPNTELLLTPGGASALYISIRVLITPNAGDEVINFNPTFAENINDVYMMGAENVFCPVLEEDNFQIRAEEFEKCITPKTRCVVLTNPSNPTGAVYTKKCLEELAKIIIKHDLAVVVDQCFERNVYDVQYINLAGIDGMKDRTLTVFGTSKDLGAAGFRIGYIAGPEKIISVLKVGASNLLGPISTFSAYGIIAGYENPDFIKEWNVSFNKRRQIGYNAFNSIPGVSCTLPNGGFFLFPNISRLGSSEEIVKYLIEDAQVAVGPGNWFGTRGEGHLRVMYGRYKDDSIFIEAMNRITKSLTKLALEKGIE